MSIRSVLVAQFEQPCGFLGHIAGWIMANRPSNREPSHWTVDLLDLQTQDRVLEIGCGPGLALKACLARIGKALVVGLDHSQTMLDQAQARNAWAISAGRLELRLGRLEDLCATNELFDKIYSVNVMQFLSDKAEAFTTLYLLLKPGGVVATTYMPRHKNPTRADALTMASEMKGHMEKCGFVGIRIEELPLEPVPAFCVLGEHP